MIKLDTAVPRSMIMALMLLVCVSVSSAACHAQHADARSHGSEHGAQASARTIPELSGASRRAKNMYKHSIASEDDVAAWQARRLHLSDYNQHTWPGFIVPERERRLGLVYRGDLTRMRSALHRQRQTGNLTVVAVGGSITAGAGAIDAHSWSEWLEDWVAARYNGSHDLTPSGTPRGVHVVNGAVPGTLSSYMSVCHNMHVPRDADIIIVEYCLNDEIHDENVSPLDNAHRRPFERLLRKLLNYPNRPAVIILNAYAWFPRNNAKPAGMYWSGSDMDFFEFATYYQLPMLSVKACCWRLMHKGVNGFNVSTTRGDEHGRRQPHDEQLKGQLFYWDITHPDGWTGHAAMSDLIIQLFMDTEMSLRRRPFTKREAVTSATSELPPPMITRNWESVEDRCLIGDGLHAVVVNVEGFTWQNDQPAKKRPKYGYTATAAGAAITFKLNTVLPYYKDRGDVQTSVQIAHLRSYQGMGKAMVECTGCKCEPTELDGHHKDKVSLLTLMTIRVTQHTDCLVKVTVRKETSDLAGGTKVKVSGVIISDEGSLQSSEQMPMGGFNAVDFVTTGLRSNSTFELRTAFAGDDV